MGLCMLGVYLEYIWCWWHILQDIAVVEFVIYQVFAHEYLHYSVVTLE